MWDENGDPLLRTTYTNAEFSSPISTIRNTIKSSDGYVCWVSEGGIFLLDVKTTKHECIATDKDLRCINVNWNGTVCYGSKSGDVVFLRRGHPPLKKTGLLDSGPVIHVKCNKTVWATSKKSHVSVWSNYELVHTIYHENSQFILSKKWLFINNYMYSLETGESQNMSIFHKNFGEYIPWAIDGNIICVDKETEKVYYIHSPSSEQTRMLWHVSEILSMTTQRKVHLKGNIYASDQWRATVNGGKIVLITSGILSDFMPEMKVVYCINTGAVLHRETNIKNCLMGYYTTSDYILEHRNINGRPTFYAIIGNRVQPLPDIGRYCGRDRYRLWWGKSDMVITVYGGRIHIWKLIPPPKIKKSVALAAIKVLKSAKMNEDVCLEIGKYLNIRTL